MCVPPAPTSSQVRKAGSRLRKILRGDLPIEQLEACLDVIALHRQAYQKPLLAANVGMRRYAEQVGVEAKVTQRLKRMATIIEKVTDRESNMSLARMRDIGGVRVVVESLDDLRRLQAHIEATREGVETIDYVKEPRASGYRAVHLICPYGPDCRLIEVQLRTRLMHKWAEMVEEVSAIVGVNRKQDGDSQFHRWARLYSRKIEAQELGKPDDITDNEWKQAWEDMLAEGSRK